MSDFKPTTGYTAGVFHTKKTVPQPVLAQGYSLKDINVLMSEDSRKKYYNSTMVVEEGDKSMDGLGLGGATGGIIGGVIAALVGLGTTLAFPGLGLVIDGPLAFGLAGVGAGSVIGGLIGTLIGWGIPETRIREDSSGIEAGGIALVVKEKHAA